jgi:2-polyprenyl-3-methyl-5-hydroxy-6-metoxy-1,4-benzoquinol methylase
MVVDGREHRVAGSCLVCGSPEAQELYALSRFSILRCRACRQVYLHPLPSPEEIRRQFDALYTTGEGEVPELRGYYQFAYRDDSANPLVQVYERWLAALERHHPPGRLLDVGCGTGLFLVVARRRGWMAMGIDECEAATRLAVDTFGCEVYTGDFEALSARVPSAAGGFDVITMWDILEHSRAPVALLEAARRRLAPGGIMGLGTPNQRNILDTIGAALYRATGGRVTRPLEAQYLSQHFLYFTPETLAATLHRAALEPIELRLEETDLRRLSLGTPTRLALRALFAIARLTGGQNRLFAVARPGVARR